MFLEGQHRSGLMFFEVPVEGPFSFPNVVSITITALDVVNHTTSFGFVRFVLGNAGNWWICGIFWPCVVGRSGPNFQRGLWCVVSLLLFLKWNGASVKGGG